MMKAAGCLGFLFLAGIAFAQGPAAAPAAAPSSAPPASPPAASAPAASKVAPAAAPAAPVAANPAPSPAAAVPDPKLAAPMSPPPSADNVSAQQLLSELQNADDPYTTTLLQTRDPFNPPPIVVDQATEKTELELVPLEQIKVTGIISGLTQQKAIIMAPNGKTHIIGERTKIGIRKGIVKKITHNSIVVRERFANVFGKEENIDTEIKIVEKPKK